MTIRERLHVYLMYILIQEKIGNRLKAEEYRQLARIALNRLKLRGVINVLTYRNYEAVIAHPTYRDIKRASEGRSFPVRSSVGASK